MNVQLDIEKIKKSIESSLTDKYVGSYEYDHDFGGGWARDYDLDADNIEEVLEKAQVLLEKANGMLTKENMALVLEETSEKLSEINVYFDFGQTPFGFIPYIDSETSLSQHFDLLVSFKPIEEEIERLTKQGYLTSKEEPVI